MKATGIVRRIDDLGRIVIPKEIRKTLKINEGSPLEIYTNNEGDVIFKKYSPVGELANLAQLYVQTLNAVLNCNCVICDLDRVIAVSGFSKKEFMDKNISDKMRELISQRTMQLCHDQIPILQNNDKKSEIISLIASSGDTLGAVIISEIPKEKAQNVDVFIKTISTLLSKQTE